MADKPLIETNPHLRNPEKLRKALIANVASSTAIETGAPVEDIVSALSESNKAKPTKKRRASAR